ncbi:HAD family hydrolase [Paenibacillus turpanensis]|uniref:HAD family hydrolase n=1 Tax=Paenibacillus turpanensis TaxID=2689078 RepID=UPI00140B5951|nr:HAD family hydrolase [Paenibacillus turpanensis]
MAIQAVLFDLDDTLLWDERSVEEAFRATCQTAQQQVGVDPVELEKCVREEARRIYSSYETFAFTQMIGINPFEGLWAHFTGGNLPEFRKLEQLAPGYRTAAWTEGLKRLGVEDAELGAKLGEQFGAERRARPLTYEETFEVLDTLKSKYRLLLLTNGAPDLQQEKLDGVPKLAAYFEHIVISGNFGRGKPDPDLFHHAIGLLGISPEEGVMIGDKLTTDILGSNRIGMRNIWINHHNVQRSGEIEPVYEVKRLRDILPIIESL